MSKSKFHQKSQNSSPFTADAVASVFWFVFKLFTRCFKSFRLWILSEPVASFFMSSGRTINHWSTTWSKIDPSPWLKRGILIHLKMYQFQNVDILYTIDYRCGKAASSLWRWYIFKWIKTIVRDIGSGSMLISHGKKSLPITLKMVSDGLLEIWPVMTCLICSSLLIYHSLVGH